MAPRDKDKAKGKGNVATKDRDTRVTPVFPKTVRVEIEPDVADDKRKELAKLTTARRKEREKMQPYKDKVAEFTERIDVLERDIDEGTEEREEKVYQELDFKRNQVRTFLAATREELVGERRTMTAEDHQHDLEQQDKDRLNANNPTDDDDDQQGE